MATAETTAAPIRIPYGPFRNEPLIDFKNTENARRMRDALAKVRAELGREYDIVIGNRLIKTDGKIKSVNPARPSEVVGIFSEAGSEHVDVAVQAAARAFESWKRISAQERADFLHNVAAILRERRLPRNVPDREAMLASLNRLESLEQSGARIFFGHDPEFWSSVPQAPASIA